jgi:hypothetical protein
VVQELQAVVKAVEVVKAANKGSIKLDMRNKLFSFIFLIIVVVTSCTDDHVSKTTPDNTLLKSSDLEVKNEWKEKFKNAKVITTETIDTFLNIRAKYKISFSSLYLDSNNSIIISSKVILLNGSKHCEFHGTISKEQHNQQTGSNVNTFSMVLIDFYKKDSPKPPYASRKIYTLYSQGKIKEYMKK